MKTEKTEQTEQTEQLRQPEQTKLPLEPEIEPPRLKEGKTLVTVPLVKKPTFITKTDPNTRKPIKVMRARPVPKGKKYEKGFVQPDYQCKEEYFYVKAMVFELQRRHPENLYAMFSSVDRKKDGTLVYWWKFINEDVLKYKHYYRAKILQKKPVRSNEDKDKIFHSNDGIASINNIDWLRDKFREIGIESSYVGLFIVEFRAGRLFSSDEITNYRNFHGNILKKFRELNQPKNLDTEYKIAMTKLDEHLRVMISHVRSKDEYEARLLPRLVHEVRLEYHNYCNGKKSRLSWQARSTDLLDEIEVSLQIITEHYQNVGRIALRAQEQISAMRPSLLTKKDIDRLNAELKQTIMRSQTNDEA